MKPSEQLRRAIEDHPESRYRLGTDTGVDPAVLCRFVHGQAGVSLDTFDKLADYLGLELKPKATKKGKRKGG